MLRRQIELLKQQQEEQAARTTWMRQALPPMKSPRIIEPDPLCCHSGLGPAFQRPRPPVESSNLITVINRLQGEPYVR